MKTVDASAVDSTSIVEIYDRDDDPLLPKFGVTVFFQHRDEADAFFEAFNGKPAD